MKKAPYFEKWGSEWKIGDRRKRGGQIRPTPDTEDQPSL